MTATATRAPKFRRNHMISFLGGSGIIRGYKPELGTWTYLVEMEMSPEPSMGRVGYETWVLLPEAELTSVN